MRRVIILGGGFGGIYTFLELHKRVKHRNDIEIVLVNRDNFFLFSPLVHEVATGGVNRESIVTPLRQILSQSKHAIFLEAEVHTIDLTARQVEMSTGTLAYEFLVLALGAETNFFGVPGAAEFSLPLKDLSDAVRIKNRLLARCEEAGREQNPERVRELLTFIIVGGGPTGVELAAELGELLQRDILRTFPNLRAFHPRLILVEATDRILYAFHTEIQTKAARTLKDLGVEILYKSPVAAVDEGGLILKHGTRIPAGTIIWTAGVQAKDVATIPQLGRAAHQRIEVLKTLQSPRFPNVFAVGDLALPQRQKVPPPMTAQVAVGEAKICAKNIASLLEGRSLAPFVYQPRGMFLSLGHLMAGAELKYARIYGKFAWILWRTFYIMKIFGWRNKVKVLVDWFFNIFSSRDLSKIE